MKLKLIALLLLTSFITCKNEEQKRKEYLESDAYKNLQRMMQESEQNLKKLRRDSFEMSLTPLKDSLFRLNNRLRALEGYGYSQDKYFPIRTKIAKLELVIAQKEKSFLAEEVARSLQGDSTLNSEK